VVWIGLTPDFVLSWAGMNQNPIFEPVHLVTPSFPSKNYSWNYQIKLKKIVYRDIIFDKNKQYS
jgi:hypothetical protein